MACLQASGKWHGASGQVLVGSGILSGQQERYPLGCAKRLSGKVKYHNEASPRSVAAFVRRPSCFGELCGIREFLPMRPIHHSISCRKKAKPVEKLELESTRIDLLKLSNRFDSRFFSPVFNSAGIFIQLAFQPWPYAVKNGQNSNSSRPTSSIRRSISISTATASSPCQNFRDDH